METSTTTAREGLPCECGARLPWPSKTQDTTCLDCGIVWEHDGVDLGGGARIKHHPAVHGTPEVTALAERMELLGSMDPADMGTVLAFVAGHAPDVFDAAVGELLDTGDDEDEDLDDDEEPYCETCGAAAGIFIGHGENWIHYRGEGTAASPVEMFDAGHEPVIAWRPAVAR
jgi:hypothetical protein